MKRVSGSCKGDKGCAERSSPYELLIEKAFALKVRRVTRYRDRVCVVGALYFERFHTVRRKRNKVVPRGCFSRPLRYKGRDFL